ncbi:hypothetical protein BUQ74_05290 [Leptospira weilii serovar Heyan]|uniref:Uncharacterized protein n=1 Tax=Leptospira weilii str. UI 13098 TaxID=1088542 RepID=M6Q2X6_9LEPT|nr:hypothetical protein LEP1GSC051_0660 [Leptospira sp. P2653]EMN89684.1 hypothetical protein LEP1GSC108_2596 [Leptospira weilii str. UI 13098]OMI18310.1 hypothetical protein BUQ74_05290 [Leptospira weilii serovar Heyan]
MWNRIARTYLFLAFDHFSFFSYSEKFCVKVKQESVILKLNSVYADGSRKISFAILEVSDSIYPQRFRLFISG